MATVAEVRRGIAERGQAYISEATGFDSGDLFATEAQVREYFTAANIEATIGERPYTQEALDLMAEAVLDNGWHCILPLEEAVAAMVDHVEDLGDVADVEAMGSEERDLMVAAGWLEQQRAAQPGGFFSDRTAAVAATRDGQAVLWSRLSDPMELGSLIPGYRGDGRILYYVGDIEDLRDDDGEVDGDWEEVDPEDYDAE